MSLAVISATPPSAAMAPIKTFLMCSPKSISQVKWFKSVVNGSASRLCGSSQIDFARRARTCDEVGRPRCLLLDVRDAWPPNV